MRPGRTRGRRPTARGDGARWRTGTWRVLILQSPRRGRPGSWEPPRARPGRRRAGGGGYRAGATTERLRAGSSDTTSRSGLQQPPPPPSGKGDEWAMRSIYLLLARGGHQHASRLRIVNHPLSYATRALRMRALVMAASDFMETDFVSGELVYAFLFILTALTPWQVTTHSQMRFCE
jgi:hypothetical protein